MSSSSHRGADPRRSSCLPIDASLLFHWLGVEDLGAQIKLMWVAWIEESIPTCPFEMGVLLGIPPEKAAAIWRRISKFWDIVGDRAYDSRTEEMWESLGGYR